ncbi:MAG: hypothetical protein ACE5OZ_08075 [Candidatus Heimdallarchaeota archaeon]
MNSQSLILLGICLALAASALQNFGMGFQKLGMERIKPISSREPLFYRIMREKNWILGTAMTFLSWGFALAALGYIGVSIVQPILIGGGIVFLVFFAVVVLGERTSQYETVGIAACTLGACLVALEAEEVKRERIDWDITALIVFASLMIAISLMVMLHSHFILKKGALSAGGAVSGILTGQGAVFARSLTLEETNPILFLISIHFWLLVMFQGASFVVLQAAFQRERAVTVVPLYAGFAVLVPVIAGILIFSERMGTFLLGGVILVLIGIVLLSRIGAAMLAPDEVFAK